MFEIWWGFFFTLLIWQPENTGSFLYVAITQHSKVHAVASRLNNGPNSGTDGSQFSLMFYLPKNESSLFNIQWTHRKSYNNKNRENKKQIYHSLIIILLPHMKHWLISNNIFNSMTISNECSTILLEYLNYHLYEFCH